MPSSTANQIITPASEKFFLSPLFPLQRQYEALRAFFVEQQPMSDIAQRFGYRHDTVRKLVSHFRGSSPDDQQAAGCASDDLASRGRCE